MTSNKLQKNSELNQKKVTKSVPYDMDILKANISLAVYQMREIKEVP